VVTDERFGSCFCECGARGATACKCLPDRGGAGGERPKIDNPQISHDAAAAALLKQSALFFRPAEPHDVAFRLRNVAINILAAKEKRRSCKSLVCSHELMLTGVVALQFRTSLRWIRSAGTIGPLCAPASYSARSCSVSTR
jgi:hypothetical protein